MIFIAILFSLFCASCSQNTTANGNRGYVISQAQQEAEPLD